MYHLFFMVTHKAWEKNLLIKYLCPRDFRRGEMEEKMIKKVIEEEMKEYESRTQILHESIVSYGNC